MEDKILVSYFPNGIKNTTNSKPINIEELYFNIINNVNWKCQIDNVRKILDKHGKGKIYKSVKAKLDYIIPGGIWSDRTKDGKLLTDSNLVQIDIDNIPNIIELERVRAALKADQHTLLMFNSPSLMGVKALFKLPQPHSINLRLSVRGYLKELYNIEVDPVVLKNKKTACYISSDNNAFYNENCEIFDILEDKYKNTNTKQKVIINTVIPTNADLSKHTQAFISKIITNGAHDIASALPGEGSKALNLAAYVSGRYSDAGLIQDDAVRAFKNAFLGRQYSYHDDAEFYRIFTAGFEAGAKQQNQKIIPNRPPEWQK